MLLALLLATLTIFALSQAIITKRNKTEAYTQAQKLAHNVALENALKIEKNLSENLNTLKTLAASFKVYQELPEEEWKQLFIDMYYKVYAETPDIYKLWDSWELQYFDTTWNKDYGRYAVTVFKEGSEIAHSTSLRSMEGDGALYAEIKSIAKDMLWEPYMDEFVEANEERKFMTSLSAPVLIDNKFVGMVAADLIINEFHQQVKQIEPYEGTQVMLISNEGIIISDPNEENIGQNIAEVHQEINKKWQLSDRIKSGESVYFIGDNESGEESIITLAPIHVGEYNNPWSLSLIIPANAVLSAANKTTVISILISIGGLLILSLVIYLIANMVTRNISKTTTILHDLTTGNLDSIQKLDIKSGDEWEDMSDSVNTLIEGLHKTSAFANEIGNGNLNTAYEPLSDHDTLGNSLLYMQKSLIDSEEETKKRKEEEEKRNWATVGLAKFGEILRSNNNDMTSLTYDIMSNLLKYIDANQGALFIIDEDDSGETCLSLVSAIAYDRNKYLKKHIYIGEALVGRCAFEQKTIYMTDIPDNYVNITSGLGTANPRVLVLIPLKLNEEIYGVIEIASFNPLEDYQVEFLEKVGESIASTISNAKTNERTQKLLEQSRTQSDELSAQEEEMRQNLEELQATQEEASRREHELEAMVKTLGNSAFVVEYDLEGTILTANERFAEAVGLPVSEIIGKSHSEGFTLTDHQKQNYKAFWQDLRNGIPRVERNQLNTAMGSLWLKETYTPIFNQDANKPYKILKISLDITSQIELENLKKELAETQTQLTQAKANMAASQSSTVPTPEVKSPTSKPEGKQEKVEREPVQAEEQAPPKSMPSAEPTAPASTAFEAKSSANQLIDWQENYKVDVEELDEQHAQLIRLANLLHGAIEGAKTKKEIKDNLRNLFDFAAYHFGNEEAYLEDIAYADIDSQKQEHKRFMDELNAFQKKLSTKAKDFSSEMGTIKTWLHHHFTNTDAAYKGLTK